MVQNRKYAWPKKASPKSSSVEGLAAADREEIRDMFARLDSDAAGVRKWSREPTQVGKKT